MDYAWKEPPYIQRFIDLEALVSTKTHFFFGPRQTGTSTLVRHRLPGARVYNLLDSPVYHELNTTNGRLKETGVKCLPHGRVRCIAAMISLNSL